MRIGVFSQVAPRPAATLDDVLTEGRSLEALGFDFITYPHIFGFDAMTIAALVGRVTQSIELTTGVVPSSPRHPVAMAQQALTVQAACDGRFSLGIGVSHQMVIEGLFGLSYAKPAKQMREYVSVLAPLLRGEPSSFDGDFYHVQAALKMPSAGSVPLILAALGPLMLEVAGSLADGTTTWMTGLQTLSKHTVPTITKAAQRAGRPSPRIIASLPIALVADVEAARAQANENFAVYNSIPSYRAMLDREGKGSLPGDVVLVGDEAELRRALSRLRDCGVTDLCAVLSGVEKGSAKRTCEFLASEL